jgi:hypothetical protein
VIITTGRIRRTLVNKINLLVDSPRSIEASHLAPVKSGINFPTSCFWLLRHVARLVVNYFDNVARPGASARRAARHAAHRIARRRLLRLTRARSRLLRLRRASECLGTSRGSSRGSSLTTPPRAGSSSTTSPPPRVRVPRIVARLVTRLVVDYFAYAVRPSASARRMARHAARRRLLRLAQARRRLLRLRRTSECLGTSRGSSRGSSPTTPPRAGSSSTTSPTPRVRCLGTSCGSSRRSSSTAPPRTSSSSTTSPTLRFRVARHVTRLVTRLAAPLVVDYCASAMRPGASARRMAHLATHRRLLRLAQARRRLPCLRRAPGCLGTSRGSSREASPHQR